jgi:hypothetical protein
LTSCTSERERDGFTPLRIRARVASFFLKRKNGLFKKAYELGVLCSADVAIIVFNANGKLFELSSLIGAIEILRRPMLAARFDELHERAGA